MNTLRVLLTTTCTPDDRKPVCCARSLSADGCRVDLGADRFLGQAAATRYVDRRVPLPHPAADLAAHIAAINENADQSGYGAVLPTNDNTTAAVTEGRALLSDRIATAVPAREPYRIARDKLATTQLAASVGLSTPATVAVSGTDDIREAAKTLGYPCVVKPRTGSGAVGVRTVHNEEALDPGFDTAGEAWDTTAASENLLIQRYIPGETCDVCALFCHGEPRTAYTQRRIWTFPSDGGVGTCVETTYDPELMEQGLTLLRALDWHGPAQVEFKRETGTGTTHVIEINGRFWGALDLSVAAGIDMPSLCCRLAVDGDVEPTFRYKAGTRYRWPVPFGFLALLDRRSRWPAARDIFTLSREVRSDLRWNDPMPALAEIAFLARRAWERRSLRPGRGPGSRPGAPGA